MFAVNVAKEILEIGNTIHYIVATTNSVPITHICTYYNST